MMNKKGLPVPPAPERAPEPRGYRIEEAAKYMGVTPWFIELKIRSGELPALKLCRHYTVLRKDMDAFLDEARKKLAAYGAQAHGRPRTDEIQKGEMST